MARPARTAQLAALFVLGLCFLVSSSVAAQGKGTQDSLPSAVRTTINEAARLEKAGKPLEAIVVLEKRLAKLPEGVSPAERRALSLALADRYTIQAEKAGQTNTAIAWYEKALALHRVFNREAAALDLGIIGYIYSYLSQNNKAVEFYNQALTIYRQIGDKPGEAFILNSTGNVYYALSDYEKALEFYNQALPIYRLLSDKPGEVSVLSSIGNAYQALARYANALEFYNRALMICRQFSDKQREENTQQEASTLYNTGNIYLILSQQGTLSQYDRALASYNQALPLYRRLGDKPGEADVLNNMGLVYYYLAQYSNALSSYNQALPIYRQVGNKQREAITLNNMGLVYYSASQYDKALAFYNLALPIYRQVDNKQGEARVLNNIGIAYYYLAQYDRALSSYDQALPIYRQVGDKPGEADALHNIGNVYLSLAQYARALEFYNQVLAIRQATGNKQREARALNNIGSIYLSLSQYDRALELHKQALAIFRRLDDKQDEASALHNLMYLYSLAQAPDHNPNLAIWYGKQAVNAYQAIRGNIRTRDQDLQKRFADSVEGTYRMLADLLIAEGRLAEAQQVLDLLKQQEYFTFVRRAPAETDAVNGTADLTPTEAEAEKKYREISDRAIKVAAEYETLLKKKPRTEAEEKRLDELFKELAEANAAFQAFLTKLDQEFAENKVVANRLDTVKDAEALTTTLARLDADTGQKTVAVYTLVGEKTLRFLVITGGVQIARTANIGAADLAKKVFAFRTALKNPRLDPRPLGKELYELLIQPIEKDLAEANAATVLWSLDGVLRYIPIAALSPDGKGYLAERDIRHSLFTPATLSRLVNAPKADWKALAVGVSKPYDVEGIHFNALTGAEAEVNGVGVLLPGRILLNSNFSETSLVRALRDGYPLVHIATHFYFRPGDEGRSFLLLGDGTALPLARLREMPATLFKGVDLLVLSACDTATGGGSGPTATGAEFESFGLLAQKKGAEAVLATLWPVADASTVLLMQEFYQIRKAILSLTKSAALRQAQLALLTGKVGTSATDRPEVTKGVAPSSEPGNAPNAPAYTADPARPYSHPYYWAGFVLIGNFR